MECICGGLQSTLGDLSELLQILLAQPPSSLGRNGVAHTQEKASQHAIKLISHVTALSLQAGSLYSKQQNRDSQIASCLVEMKGVIKLQKRKISELSFKNPTKDCSTSTEDLSPSRRDFDDLVAESNAAARRIKELSELIALQNRTNVDLNQRLEQSKCLLAAQQIMISDLEGVRRFVPSMRMNREDGLPRLYDQAPSRGGSHHAQGPSRGAADDADDLYLDHASENVIPNRSDEEMGAAHWAEERAARSSAVVPHGAGKESLDGGDDDCNDDSGDDGNGDVASNEQIRALPFQGEDTESVLLEEDVHYDSTSLTEENLCSFQSSEAEADSFSRSHPYRGGDSTRVRKEEAEGEEGEEQCEGTSSEQLCSVCCEEAYCSCVSASWIGSASNVEDSFALVKNFYEPTDGLP